MNKKHFSSKLAASIRKAKKMIPEVKSKSASLLATNIRKDKKIIPEVKPKSASSLVANKNKAKKKIPEVKPKSAPSPELASPNDLLNPTDFELLLKQQYAERIWPD